MKTYTIIVSVSIVGLIFSSCQKFIDIKKNSNQFYLTTANDCQLLLDDYTKMNTNYPIDGEISADDYYLNRISYQLANIPDEEKNLYDWNSDAQRISSNPNWVGPYGVVYSANLALETLNKLKQGSDDQALVDALKGAALFYRAYSFWNVAQIYARPYTTGTANQDPGIPLKLDPDINTKSSRGTVGDTYSRIIQDLQDALTLLPKTSQYVTRPNKIAAYAMLARTYLSMGDYPNALINANAALDIKKDLIDYNSISQSSPIPFTRFNKEVIFHTISKYNNSAPFAGPILVPGSTLANSSVARINPDLVTSYNINDLRGKIFLKANTINATLDDPSTNPISKKTVPVQDGSFRFTGNYEPTVTPTFFTGLAVDEILLIRAECYIRTGNAPLAIADLNYLLKNRWKAGTYVDISNNISAENILSIILSERRKELLMRGLRWTDLRRLNMSATRITKDVTFSGTIGNPIKTESIYMSKTLPANDPRYTLLIPKMVLDNSNISQNPR